jgi:hypothetical protein
MSDNNAISTLGEELEEATNEAEPSEPVVSGPSKGEVKDINGVGDDHPLVEETGDSALKTETESGAGEFLSDFIYEHDSAWVREWLQNHETACVRAAKLLIRLSDEYPDGWLNRTLWINDETGETVVDYSEGQRALAEFAGDTGDLRVMEVPRPIDEVLEASRSLGYDPTIVFDVYRDERKIVTEDNGIGMTPYEFDEAFNTIFNSGSGVDGETGGMFGVGSESSALVHGNDGGATVTTKSRRPGDHDGFRAYSYLGGANALPGEVDEDFRGTEFDIPVQDSFNLSKLHGWIKNYSEKLRVPLLYREHDAGTTPVEEEYEATDFTDDYGDPPITIHRPGEFSLVSGPNVYDSSYNSDDNNTFLVSMPIERNNPGRIRTLWDCVIQIHDEQGRIVAGPNRGLHADDVDSLHEDDVKLPQPTGDRDRLQKDDDARQFYDYVQELIEEREIQNVSDIAHEMADTSPSDAIQEDFSDWKLFRRVVSDHGHRATSDRTKFKEFVQDQDSFPDFDSETIKQIFGLFKDVEYCKKGAGRSSNKRNRYDRSVGKILSNHGDSEIYMAASTGGNFTHYFRVIENTHPNAKVVVVSGSRKYKTYADLYGWKKLVDVPLQQSDDHDYDVPDKVHEAKKKKAAKTNTGKADKIAERTLKIRTDSSNTSIDARLTIESAKDRISGNGRIGGHDKLMLFPKGGNYENISDHYDMARYAAIASVSKTEYDELAHLDSVVTLNEYTEWSESALIATEDGAMTPEEIVEDDRMVIMAERSDPSSGEVLALLGDDNEELRTKYANDVRDQYKWAAALDGYDGGYRGDDIGEVPDSEKDDTLFAVACQKVLRRASYAFAELNYDRRSIQGLQLTRYSLSGKKWPRQSLDGDKMTYRLMSDTPNWDDDSDVYDIIKNRDSRKAQLFLGLHDRGIDPTKKDTDDLRDLI